MFDCAKDDLGIKEGVGGAIQVEGAWYRPNMPEPLIEATADLHKERIDEATWQQRIAARAPYGPPPATSTVSSRQPDQQHPGARSNAHLEEITRPGGARTDALTGPFQSLKLT